MREIELSQKSLARHILLDPSYSTHPTRFCMHNSAYSSHPTRFSFFKFIAQAKRSGFPPVTRHHCFIRPTETRYPDQQEHG